MSSKAIENVLYRIDYTIESFRDNPDAVTFPLQYTTTEEWGYGIHCAKGLWVAECDPDIVEEVLEEFNKRKMEEMK